MLIVGIINKASSRAFGLAVFPIIDALYLTPTIKVKNIIMNTNEEELAEYIKAQTRLKSRCSLVKNRANAYADKKLCVPL